MTRLTKKQFLELRTDIKLHDVCDDGNCWGHHLPIVALLLEERKALRRALRLSMSIWLDAEDVVDAALALGEDEDE